MTPHRKRRSRNLARAQRHAAARRTATEARNPDLLRRLRHAAPVLLTALVLLGGLRTPVVGDLTSRAIEATAYEAGREAPTGTTTSEAAIRTSAALAAGSPSMRTARPFVDPDTAAVPLPGEASTPDAAATGEAEGSASVEVEDEPLPVFFQYEVQPGDTASQIAERFGIATDYILWNNVNVIDDADSLAVGAMLQIPSVEGIIHSVRVGDTVGDIAVEYDSTTEQIVEFEANGFGGDPNMLPVGALILVPDGRRIPPPAPAFDFGDPFAPDPNAPDPGSSEPAPSDPSAPPWTPPALVPPPPPAPTWVWPATGRLTNVFSPRHPLGIDISMVVNTPIAAASAGQVTFVGGNPCCSYGYHVIIEHADGHETLYAHLSQFWVSSGQWVGAGELIGASGNTGYSTGPHLHFEVRKHGVYTNPLGYLP